MQVLITARHSDIPDALRERAEELLNHLARKAHRPTRAEVVFDTDHQQKIVELHMYLPRAQPLIAKAEADEFRTALDRAVEKLRHQIEKDSGRIQQKVKTG